MRSAERVRKCLLFGVDRTYRGHHETDASDPLQTSLGLRKIVADGAPPLGALHQHGGSAQGREHKARMRGLNLVPCRTSHGNGCPIPHSPVGHPGSGSDMLFGSHLEQLKLNEPVNSRILENAWRLEQLLNIYQ